MNSEIQSVQQPLPSSNSSEFERRHSAEIRTNELLRRAYAAYYSFATEPLKRYAMKSRETHPDPAYSWVNKKDDGREYVILANMKAPLAVYQVRSRDLLQRLKSFGPSVLECDQMDFSKLD